MKAAQEMAVELLRRQKQRETNTKRDKYKYKKKTRTNTKRKDRKYPFETAASCAPVPQRRAVPRPP